jgi:hypothetical protein
VAEAAPSGFWRTLWKAPEVGRLGADAALDLPTILESYEAMLSLADRAVEIGRQARRQSNGFVIVSDDREHITIVPPEPEEEEIRIDLLRESNPASFDEAIAVIEQIGGLPDAVIRAFAAEATSSAFQQLDPDTDPTDADFVTGAILPAARQLVERVREDEEREAADAAYVAERERWIAACGSERLKLAAARGYKHDAIYRDERLARELPGFVGTLPRNSQVREAINPSAEALEAESEVLAGIDSGNLNDADVRIVWVHSEAYEPPGSGEYVQLKGYLGRHSIFRRISPEEEMPF